MEEINLKKFQFVLVDEKKTWIKYPGVEDKGPRPYLVVRSNLYGKLFVACPMLSWKDIPEQKKSKIKSSLRLDFDEKPSHIKMNLPVIFPMKFIEQGVVHPIDKHLNKSLRKIAIKLLKDSFDN